MSWVQVAHLHTRKYKCTPKTMMYKGKTQEELLDSKSAKSISDSIFPTPPPTQGNGQIHYSWSKERSNLVPRVLSLLYLLK